MVGFIHMKIMSFNERFTRAFLTAILYMLAIHYIAPNNGSFNAVVLYITFMFLSAMQYFEGKVS